MRIRWLSLTLLFALPAWADEFADLKASEGAVLKSKDLPKMTALFAREVAVAPNVPVTHYNVACMLARSGSADAAVKQLEVLAGMGLSFDLDGDSDLSSLHARPDYAAVKAKMKSNSATVQVKFEPLLSLPKQDLIAEDAAYDPISRRYFVSSVRERKIIVSGTDGTWSDWVKPSKDLPSFLGIVVDAKRKHVFGTYASTPLQVGLPFDAKQPSGIAVWELKTGKLLHRYDTPVDGTARLLGDMTLAKDGTVWATDSFTGALYRLPPDAKALEVFLPAGTFMSGQQPAESDDGKSLYVADWTRGIARVDLASRRVTWLSAPANIALTGVDGLVQRKGELVAVQNGTRPERVVRFKLNDDGSAITGVTVIDQGSPGLGEPTHGLFVGDDYVYLADGGQNRFDEKGNRKASASPPSATLRRAR